MLKMKEHESAKGVNARMKELEMMNDVLPNGS
jgi:hypothetical protein